jgi:hypothetical protein
MQLFCSEAPAASSSSSSSSSSSAPARKSRRHVVSSAPRPNTAAFNERRAITFPLYPHKHVTLYIHSLAHFQFLLDHQQLHEYCCSSLEKRNHLHTIDFFRATSLNGFGQLALKQILVRELILFVWDSGEEQSASSSATPVSAASPSLPVLIPLPASNMDTN